MARKLKKLSTKQIFNLVACLEWQDLDMIKKAMRGKTRLDPLEIAKSAHVRREDRLWILLQIMSKQRFHFPYNLKREFAEWFYKSATQKTKDACNYVEKYIIEESCTDALNDLVDNPMLAYLEDYEFENSKEKVNYNRKLLRKITSLMEKWLKGDS